MSPLIPILTAAGYILFRKRSSKNRRHRRPGAIRKARAVRPLRRIRNCGSTPCQACGTARS